MVDVKNLNKMLDDYSLEDAPYIKDPTIIKYNEYHRKRFALLRKILNAFTLNWRCRVLELGPWRMRNYLKHRGVQHWTMGMFDERVCNFETHIEMNFSTLPNGSTHIGPKFDVILCCEVIEHLPINMDTMYEFLNSQVKPGGILIIQTPNGVSLKNRLAMLFGKNPFPLIDKTEIHSHNHIREYTLKELLKFGSDNGFRVLGYTQSNYFSYDHSLKAKAYQIVSWFLPRSLKDGTTIIYQNINY